ncbi:MAG: CDP-alcohol phosphatidyltransferase family protein [Candidatus Kerfeldbacteria bacterium]|nr:CDP-alcohol phosphatidyltransferase family protein [Candidatus Kerfeldbacteria bacterium]
MSIASTRWSVWQRLRTPFEAWFAALPLPRINPDLLSLASLSLALLFAMAVWVGVPFVAWVFLAVHLLLDGIDGAVARRYRFRRSKRDRLHGQLVDFAADRGSEFLLFLLPAFFVPWFALFVVNVALTIISVAKQRALALPLRQAFFIVYSIQLLV